MTHLYIEQATDRTEEVNSSIISKLYELAISGDLDNTSDLKGRLHSSTAYKLHLDWLTQHFDELYINADNYYISFNDPLVELILAPVYGDSVGVTLAQAASVSTNFNKVFQNTNIESFDELKYFTGITRIAYYGAYYSSTNEEFTGCTNLKSIDATNIERIEGKMPIGIEHVKNFNGDLIGKVYMEGYEFSGCSNLHTINLSNCQYFGKQAFNNCSNLEHVGDLKKTKLLSTRVFCKCTKLAIDVNMPDFGNYTSTDAHGYLRATVNGRPSEEMLSTYKLAYGVFYKSGITSVSNLGSNITELADGTYVGEYAAYLGVFNSCTNLRFVILPSQLTTIGTYAFSDDTALLYVKVLNTTPPTLNSTDTSNRSFPFYNTTCKFYVPDASVNDYKSASGWSSMSSRIFSINQFATDFPDDYAAEQAALQNS